MNDEDFESKLRSTPLRRAPQEWRKEILDAAESVVSTSTPRESIGHRIFQLLSLRPGWSFVMVLWMASLVFRFAAPDVSDGPMEIAHSKPLSPQVVMYVWNRHVAEFPFPIQDRSTPPKPTPIERPRSFLFPKRQTHLTHG